MSGMAAPRITLRCDCGAEELVAYGERWTCGSCGRTYDTAGIPSADFEAIQSLRRRYRIIGYTGVALIAAFVLLLALTAQEFQLFIGLPGDPARLVHLRPAVHAQPLPPSRRRAAAHVDAPSGG